MTAAPKTPTVYERWLAVPEHMTGEIIDGELHIMSRPAPPHLVAASELGIELGIVRRGGGGGPSAWIVLDEPEIHIADNILVPDIGGWKRERYEVPQGAAFIEVAPDWICEILSPTTAAKDRVKKMRVYRQWGVRWAWLIDPIARTLEVYRGGGEGADSGLWVQFAVFEGDTKVRAEPFANDGEIDLARLWNP